MIALAFFERDVSRLVTRALDFRSVAGTIGEENLRPPTAPDEYSPVNYAVAS